MRTASLNPSGMTQNRFGERRRKALPTAPISQNRKTESLRKTPSSSLPGYLFPKRKGFYRMTIHLKFFFISLNYQVPSSTRYKCWVLREKLPPVFIYCGHFLGNEPARPKRTPPTPHRVSNRSLCPDAVSRGTPINKTDAARPRITSFRSTLFPL